MEALLPRICAFLDKYDSSTPELADIFDAHQESVRRILQDARRDGLVHLTGKWNGKAPMYRGKRSTVKTPQPDETAHLNQVDEKLNELFTTMYSVPTTVDVRMAIRSIVAGAVSGNA